MNDKIIERRRMESDLRYAINHDELRLHFQPRYRISDGQMVGGAQLQLVAIWRIVATANSFRGRSVQLV